MSNVGEEEEGIALEKKWEELRPRVIRPLGELSCPLLSPLSEVNEEKITDLIVSIDRVSQAYALAEHHNDYETLVWLCHVQMGGGSGVVRLQEYIERFGEEFAFVLYQWYINQGKL
jgi:nuclear pore complex protein Nup133